VPDASVRPLPIELERYDAVAMFVDSAQARDPEFALDDDNAPHVREICRRLDGLPLALELAAARVGLLPPAELATRLDHALAVLTSGARDAPDRQRTLRATIDWSHDLLTDTERQAFARIAAFPAGASLAAAELVTGARSAGRATRRGASPSAPRLFGSLPHLHPLRCQLDVREARH
jgi:predicted ATPase